MRYTLPRTATFAWSPATYDRSVGGSSTGGREDDPFALPLLATGTASGALDASFSTEAKLELWSPFGSNGLAPKGAITVNSRFNKLVWGGVGESRPRGVIAAGMENGELDIWDPAKILQGNSAEASLVHKSTNHAGAIRGLDFNPVKNNLLASGASKGEVFIWDLNNPVKPFAPPASRSLDDVSAVGWNRVVQSVLAASSVNGYTVVWDIREANGQKGREVSALSYSGAGAGYPGQGGPGYGGQWGGPGGRPGGVSSVVWHPDNPTKLASASEDDASPVVVIWDLRNARAPERVLTGHEKGVLSLAWCQQDANLLVSCGKDCRTLVWNPNVGELVAELAPGSNWAFQTEWCPRNPDLLATASFDGRISVNSLQSTRDEPEAPAGQGAAPQGDANDIFGDQGILALNNARATVSLKQAPKWLKRPASASFGFGGKVITISHRTLPQQPTQPGQPAPPPQIVPSVKVQPAVTERAFVERAVKLEHAAESGTLDGLCEERSRSSASSGVAGEETNWKLLHALFRADSRDELVTLLGFSKEDVKAKVEQQISAFKASQAPTMSRSVSETANLANAGSAAAFGSHESDTGSVPREPLVTFADTPVEGLSSSSDGGEAAASLAGGRSDASVSAVTDSTQVAESELTEPSLFGEDAPAAPTQQQASADFYNSIRNGRPAALPDHVFGRSVGAASSVGATIGSRASSVASENLKANTFKIYPADESKGDRLITRALVLGDFDSAVSLCLSTDRFADALLLAVRGGPELLHKTQKAYFERQTASLPYLRLYQSIVLDDLVDVVQNAELKEWQEIFVVLCTFAKAEEFPSLAEQLGQRLEYQYESSLGSSAAIELRKNAILCYLAAGRLEKVISIWVDQMREEEEARVKSTTDTKSRYSVHVDALQTFIEKVTIFQAAVKYVDTDLAQPTASAEVAATGARTYKLATLYDRYSEYAELLAAQGLVTSALRFIAMTPSDYAGSRPGLATLAETRERLAKATGTSAAQVAPARQPAGRAPISQPVQSAYAATYQPPPAQQGPYAPVSNGYNYASPYGQPQQQQGFGQAGYGQADPYGQSGASNPYAQPATNNFMPPPPPPITSAPPAGANSSGPPPKARDAGGWNDAPSLAATRKAAGSAAGHRAAITSPFPNAGPMSPGPQQYGQFAAQAGQNPPPPPRAGTRTPAQVPPPPRVGQQPPPQQQPGQGPYGARPGSVGPYGPPRPGSVQGGRPGGPQGFGPQQGYQPQQQPGFGGPGGPPQGQYAPQQQSAPFPGPGGVSQSQSQYAPPANQGPYAPPANQGPYAPPANTGPYAPPPGQQQPPPQQQQQPPYGQIPNGGPRSGPGGFVQPGLPRAQGSPAPTPAPAPPKPEPPKSKYPPGDRSHIPDQAKPILATLSRQMAQLKQTAPPNQKKLVDDTERRLNTLFDALNCETLPPSVIDELLEIVKAMDARNPQQALQLHLSLLTSGVKADHFTTFMPAIKMLISTIR